MVYSCQKKPVHPMVPHLDAPTSRLLAVAFIGHQAQDMFLEAHLSVDLRLLCFVLTSRSRKKTAQRFWRPEPNGIFTRESNWSSITSDSRTKDVDMIKLLATECLLVDVQHVWASYRWVVHTNFSQLGPRGEVAKTLPVSRAVHNRRNGERNFPRVDGHWHGMVTLW